MQRTPEVVRCRGQGLIRVEWRRKRVAIKFEVGDHVRWNSEAGYVSGRIIRIHTRDTQYKGHTRHASEAEPQYEIQSDKTDHIAMHKGAVLHKID
jgi:Hypervirulence associated proteins TUDOR domain